MEINITLDEGAIAPTKGTDGAAAYDLYANSGIERRASRGSYIVGTGVYIEIPPGYVGLVYERSSTSKLGLSLRNKVGVIDSDYRGEILLNMDIRLGFDGLKIGTRIAQLIIQRCEDVEFRVCSKLEPTPRGAGGFGSTDKLKKEKHTELLRQLDNI